MKPSLDLVLSKTAAELLRREAGRKWPFETGGILLGSKSNGTVMVEHATGPGPKARHGVASFTRDGDYAQQELERLVEHSKGGVDYIGEWHSHTLPVGPSPRDRKSMALIAVSAAYNLDEPLLLLCLPRRIARRPTWTFRGYGFFRGSLVEFAGVAIRS
jgi:integrative and conjugative element protein (TIGR02256 family)